MIGRATEAEQLLKRALAIREKALGPDHPQTIAKRNELALFYLTTGRDAAAVPLVKQLLASGETALGANQPETVASLTELARCYERLAGHYARQSGGKTEAETLLVRALAIKEKVRGPEHPDVARLLENLAFVYGGKDRGAEADALLTRALAIREKELGAEDPGITGLLNLLAVQRTKLGRVSEAETLLKRILAIMDKARDADHVVMALFLNNLASLYSSQGRTSEYEAVIKRIDAIEPRRDNPPASRDKGPAAEAEPLLKRIDAIRTIRARLGGSGIPQNREESQFEIATLTLLGQPLAIYEKSFAGESSLASVTHNIRSAHESRTKGRDFRIAERLATAALAAAEEMLMVEYAVAAVSLDKLVDLYQAQGRDAEAEPLIVRARVIDEMAQGSTSMRP
jgi:tetratricopeptide (TPR) repeat protein